MSASSFDSLGMALDSSRRDFRISRLYADSDEIDQKLLESMLHLLNQYRDGEISPHDALLQLSKWTMEFLPSPLSAYHTAGIYREQNDDQAIRHQTLQGIQEKRDEFLNGTVPSSVRDLLDGTQKYHRLRRLQKEWEGRHPIPEPAWYDFTNNIIERTKNDYPNLWQKAIGQREGYLSFHDFHELVQRSPHLTEDDRALLIPFLRIQERQALATYREREKTYKAYEDQVGRHISSIDRSTRVKTRTFLTVDQLFGLYFELEIERHYADIEYQASQAHIDPEALLAARAGITGTGPYHLALAECVKVYQEAATTRDRLLEALSFRIAFGLFTEDHETRRNMDKRDRLAEKAVTASQSYRRKTQRELERHMRQVALQRAHYPLQVTSEISALMKRASTGELDGWDLAKGMAALIVRPDYSATPKTDRQNGRMPTKKTPSLLAELHQDIDADRASVAASRKSINPELTLAALQPQTEDDMRAELTHDFNGIRAKAFVESFEKEARIWVDEQARNGNKKRLYESDYAHAVHGDASYRYNREHEIKNSTEWQVPLEFPDRLLCDGIRIDPSGTALICPYASDSGGSGWEDYIYGVSVARITTYSLTFKPRQPEDIETLNKVLAGAFRLLDQTSYRYSLPSRVKDAYARSVTGVFSRPMYTANMGEDGETESSLRYGWFKRTTDEWVQAIGRLDLDDAFRLYYILEPILEPNAQIAASFNAARYAEERGAVLEPSPNYADNQSQEVADPISTLPQDLDKIFPAAMREMLLRVALREPDADLLVQFASVASLTLSGGMRDPTGQFPSFDRLLEEDRQAGGTGTALTFPEAFRARFMGLIAYATGQSTEMFGDNPLLAFRLADHQIGRTIRKVFRGHTYAREEAAAAAIAEHEQKMRDEIAKGGLRGELGGKAGDAMKSRMSANRDRLHRLHRLSDILNGRAPSPDEETLSAEESKLRKQRIATQSGLIITGSQVEATLDRIVVDPYASRSVDEDDDTNGETALAFYRTKMAGSPFVRHELPEKLAAFVRRDHDPQHAAALVRQIVGPS